MFNANSFTSQYRFNSVKSKDQSWFRFWSWPIRKNLFVSNFWFSFYFFLGLYSDWHFVKSDKRNKERNDNTKCKKENLFDSVLTRIHRKKSKQTTLKSKRYEESCWILSKLPRFQTVEFVLHAIWSLKQCEVWWRMFFGA